MQKLHLKRITTVIFYSNIIRTFELTSILIILQKNKKIKESTETPLTSRDKTN